MMHITITKDGKTELDMDVKVIAGAVGGLGSDHEDEMRGISAADDATPADLIAALITLDEVKERALEDPIVALGYALRGTLFDEKITIDESAIKAAMEGFHATD